MNQLEKLKTEEQLDQERKSKEWNRQIDQIIAKQGGYLNTSCIGGINITEFVPNRRYNSMD